MKILITVGIFPPDIGGPASFVPKIANNLTDKNIKVTVLCLSESKIIDNTNYKVVRILRNQNLIIRWIKTVLLIIKNGWGANILFVNGLPMESYIANLILRKKVVRKIVGDWAWERGRNKGLISESFEEFQENKHNLHLKIAKFSRGWTAARSNIVITPSNHLKKVVTKWGVNENKIKVIYNGTKITDDLKIPNNNLIRFITVGRLAPWKNINVMIDSMKLLEEDKINYVFYIVGSGPLLNELKDQVNLYNLNKKIIFTGQKNKVELEKIYRESDIYLQASGYEGLPHVILEAMNYNLSIISTPIGGTNEVLLNGENGWVVNLKDGKCPDHVDLKNVISKVLNSKKIDTQKKIKAKNFIIENFNEIQNIEQYKNYLRT